MQYGTQIYSNTIELKIFYNLGITYRTGSSLRQKKEKKNDNNEWIRENLTTENVIVEKIIINIQTFFSFTIPFFQRSICKRKTKRKIGNERKLKINPNSRMNIIQYFIVNQSMYVVL